MNDYDGTTLRSIRESVSVPLRRVARLVGMSHGHLSKVERGEHGRPVTPAVLAAYERASGVRLTSIEPLGSGAGGGWRRGRLSDVRRVGFNAQIAGIAVGGPVGEPIARMIDSLGRMTAPTRIGLTDVTLVEQAAHLATAQDLRAGGGLIHQLARVTLRWAVGLTTATMTSREVHQRLHTAIGHLAQRAGWAALDIDNHDAARHMFTVALDAAVQAHDRNLRAHVLADVAAQHNYLGYPDDALDIIALAEGDHRRTSRAIAMVLSGVAARAHATATDADQARQRIAKADEHHSQAVDVLGHPEWLAAICTPARLHAVTGHAAATLAHHTRTDADWHDAHQRLTRAVELLNPTADARAYTFCTSRLAILHLDANEVEQASRHAYQALRTAADLRSNRVDRHLRTVLATARADPDNLTLKQLAVDIDAALHLTPDAGAAVVRPGVDAQSEGDPTGEPMTLTEALAMQGSHSIGEAPTDQPPRGLDG